MRVTNSMTVVNFMRNLSTNERSLDKYQSQLSTGHRINKPSDDPVGVINALRYSTNINESEEYINNIDTARDFLNTTDSSLGNVSEILQRANELLVRGITGTNSDTSQESIATEIRQLAEQIKVIANTTYGTKYIYGGTNVTEEPFTSTGWVGNDKQLTLEIGVGVTVAVNSNMGDFFYNADPANPGAYQLLNDIADNLDSSDTTALNTNLTQLQTGLDNLNQERAIIGAKVNRLDLQENRLETTSANYTELLSKAQDADMAEVIMNLKMQESVYKASLEAGSRIILPTLADYLR